MAERVQARQAVADRALDGPSDSANANPLQLVHRLLRGRYLTVVPCAVVLASLGGVISWQWTRPQYRSEGLIEVKYAQPAVDPAAAQTGATPFQVFIESQKTLIGSRRVVDRALEEPAWIAVRRPHTSQAIRQFIASLDVKSEKGTEYLKISFTDDDPLVAAAAVKAITSAYVAIYKEDEQNLESTRLRLLKQNKSEVEQRIQRMQLETDQTVKRFGSADLGLLQSAAVMRTTRLDSAIDDIRLILASRTSDAPSAVVPSSQPAEQAPATALTPEQIAQSDAVMRRLLDEQRKLQEDLQLLQVQGYRDSHPSVVQLRYRLESATERVRQYASEYATVQQATGRTSVTGAADRALLSTKSSAQLRLEEQRLTALRDAARSEMGELAAEQLRQTRRDADLRRDHEALDLITKRLDQLQDQEQMGGRLTVISAGEVPLSTEPDKRLKLAGAGAVLGGSLPVGAVVLLGLLRRRYKFADETVADLSPTAPLLGILPALDGNIAHESALLAAHRIHQIRVMLQVTKPSQKGSAYLITSASAGEGKTSLAMALGLSFAATGLRTLLIDGDLVGQQVTRGMDARNVPGLNEALRSGSLRGLVRRTAGGLCVLTVGNVGQHDGCAVSPDSVELLIRDARRYFDTILVDSGPILGSVEASLIARAVDHVLLTVAQGQQPPLVQRALRHIHSLGANVCGFVFNRATASDFQGSYYGSSSRSAHETPGGLVRLQRSCRFGPLVAAVISTLPGAMQPSFAQA